MLEPVNDMICAKKDNSTGDDETDYEEQSGDHSPKTIVR